MSSIEEQLSDLEATVNYIRGEITEQSDDVAFEDAVALVERLQRVKKAVEDAISLLTTRELALLEKGTRQIGTTVYASVPKTIGRTDHEYVRDVVAVHAIKSSTDRDGVVSVGAAVSTAIEDMMKLYVSNSRNATKGGLKRIGAKIGRALHEEDQGRKIQVVDLAAKQTEEDDDED